MLFCPLTAMCQRWFPVIGVLARQLATVGPRIGDATAEAMRCDSSHAEHPPSKPFDALISQPLHPVADALDVDGLAITVLNALDECAPVHVEAHRNSLYVFVDALSRARYFI